MQQQQPGRLVQAGRAATLLVTNAIKLGGLWVALHEAIDKPNPRVTEIGLAAFMMAGAQISEETILGLVGRMFGTAHAPEPLEPAPAREQPSSGGGE